MDGPGRRAARCPTRSGRRGHRLGGLRRSGRRGAGRRLRPDVLRPPAGGRVVSFRPRSAIRRTGQPAPLALPVADDGVHEDRAGVVVRDLEGVRGLDDVEHGRPDLEAARRAAGGQRLPRGPSVLVHPEQSGQPVAAVPPGDDGPVVRGVRVVDAVGHEDGHLAARADLGEAAVGLAQGAPRVHDADMVDDLLAVEPGPVVLGRSARGRRRSRGRQAGRSEQAEPRRDEDSAFLHAPSPSPAILAGLARERQAGPAGGYFFLRSGA
ncbi:MAG: hypothetical protein MZV64_33980 [Ignavibacteriales bacterium]|nr:hypothetical protein [Ignavibacteriales bacterium]